MIANRIVGHGEEAPDQLLANPLNYRRHPGEQLEALRGSLRQLGWVKEILVNKTSGFLVDGHARVEEAMRLGVKAVPVTYVELAPDEERLAMALLDPITEMATRDKEALDGLLAGLSSTEAGVNAVLEDLKEGPASQVTVRVYTLVFEDEADMEAWGKLIASIKQPGDTSAVVTSRLMALLRSNRLL